MTDSRYCPMMGVVGFPAEFVTIWLHSGGDLLMRTERRKAHLLSNKLCFVLGSGGWRCAFSLFLEATCESSPSHPQVHQLLLESVQFLRGTPTQHVPWGKFSLICLLSTLTLSLSLSPPPPPLSLSRLDIFVVVVQASSKLLKIAPATVLALAGAFYALTALSHHVQVEVFVI